jgi:hypothetical protein
LVNDVEDSNIEEGNVEEGNKSLSASPAQIEHDLNSGADIPIRAFIDVEQVATHPHAKGWKNLPDHWSRRQLF